MEKLTEKIEMMTLPVIPLFSIVAFPTFKQSIELSKESYKNICIDAKNSGEPVIMLPLLDPTNDKIENEKDFYSVGTVVNISDYLKLPDEDMRVVFEGLCRCEVVSVKNNNGKLKATVLAKNLFTEDEGGIKGQALVRETLEEFDDFSKFLPKLSSDVKLAVRTIKSPGLLADFIAANVLVNFDDKYEILSEFDPFSRIEKLSLILEKEKRIFKTELELHKKVLSNIEEGQREHYLREQLKVIQNELGFDEDDEIIEYSEKIEKANLPKEIKTKLEKEVIKLRKMPYTSAESSVIRLYLDTVLELPWNKKTKDRLDVESTKKILERDHDGLEKVKERIVEYIAVKQLNPELKNQIICLVGPPGTGKTSIAHSIAEAMKRKYVRVSLGGVRDEADIRGHRKTYIGSMPGRILTGITEACSSNPVMLLDEVDKMSNDRNGDPSSALLEVLDSEQNHAFRDHFVELPFDLSDVFFIATANEYENIPRPLLDRMEIIELKAYTRSEKIAIAKHHLIPKQEKRHGIKRTELYFDESALFELIDNYTREAGVRNLERKIAEICRKAAMRLVENKEKKIKVSSKNIEEFLGKDKYIPTKIYDCDEVGTVNGLAYTESGGDLLKIECAVMPGQGKIELTGSLGDVMKESAKAAVSYVRQNAEKLGICPDFYKTKDIHIHVPEGAVPKDGPSAGVTIVTALVSELTGIPVKHDIAMTGEITLRGRVLAIGGLREKTMAALRAGVKNVIIPKENEKDLEKLDSKVKSELGIHFSSDVREVLTFALCENPFSSSKSIELGGNTDKKNAKTKSKDSENKSRKSSSVRTI